MKFRKYSILFILCFFSAPTMANITIAGAASRSVIMTSEDFESKNEYILEINISGIDPRNIILQSTGQMLVLEARQTSTNKNSQAGSQGIFYTYTFNDNADMEKKFVQYLGNNIKIIIPKRKL